MGHNEVPAALDAWEACWAPYDESTYGAVLAALDAEDVVLDIGAGDLRLARRLAQRCRFVFAVEQNPALLPAGRLPTNLQVITADAREMPFPKTITTAVLLMRHCRHFDLYWRQLMATSCRRLITNARWRTGLEIINLRRPRLSYDQHHQGWYGCHCGAAGFRPGPADRLSDEMLSRVVEVVACPRCAYG